MSIILMVQLALFASHIIVASAMNISPRTNDSLSHNGEFPEGKHHTIRSLRVSSTHFEPFMYQDKKTGQFYNGIEYKLLSTIAKKERLDLIIQNTSGTEHLIHEYMLGTIFQTFSNKFPTHHFLSGTLIF